MTMDRFLRFLSCAGILLMLAGCGGREEPEPEPTPPPSTAEGAVVVEEIFPANLQQVIDTAGTIEAAARASLRATVAGPVIRIPHDLGGSVRKGDLIAEIDSTAYLAALEGARSGVERLEADFDQARRLFEEKRALHDRHAIPWSEYREAKRELDAAAAALDSARAALDPLMKKMEQRKVRSPLAGTVTHVALQVGDVVSVGQQLCTVSDLSRMNVKCAVERWDAASLEENQAVTLEIDLVPGREYRGRITTVASAPDRSTGQYALTVECENPGGTLGPGPTGAIRIFGERREGVLTVPRRAVVERDGREVIYVVDGERALEREVELGIGDGERIEIVEGLAEWEYVVVKGQEGLEDSAAVTLPEP
jgi:RND family efflux transporter MFP subunit